MEGRRNPAKMTVKAFF
ncbi:rCG28338, partial [Rattus norvegicus]